MPAIPLERGVLLYAIARSGLVCHSTTLEALPAIRSVLCMTIFGERILDADQMRVDLDTPAGFAYATRWLYGEFEGDTFDAYLEQSAEARGYNDGDTLLLSILLGYECETTDADRLALARACAEVTR